MKIQQLNEIRREDLEGDVPAWVDPILVTLNSFMRSVYQVVMGKISIDDNLNEEVIVLTINTNDIPTDGFKIKLKKLQGIPRGCQVAQIRVKDEGSHSAVSGAGYVDWLYEDGFLKIYSIAGLTTTDHLVTLRVF